MLLLLELKHGARPILVMKAKMSEMLLWSYAAVSHSRLECSTQRTVGHRNGIDQNVENGSRCIKMWTNGHWFSTKKICICIRSCQQLLLLQLLGYEAPQASLFLPHVTQHVLPKEDVIL